MSLISTVHLERFVEESNRIEGLLHGCTSEEFRAHYDLLKLEEVTEKALSNFVRTVAGSTNRLRDLEGLDVRVGAHVPMGGSPRVRTMLTGLLASAKSSCPWQLHRDYQTLHPYTDGNGRSGRALWLWCVRRQDEGTYRRALRLGFLHSWYYASLEANDRDGKEIRR